MSQGTRCHQLALYMVLDSPLNMLCDSPSNYLAEEECCNFIAGIPTIWDETRFLDGHVGEYVVSARRSGDEWYVGGITDWNSRTLNLELSFLPEGEYELTLFMDGVNANRKATDYKVIKKTITRAETLTVLLAQGGGFALKLEKKAK